MKKAILLFSFLSLLLGQAYGQAAQVSSHWSTEWLHFAFYGCFCLMVVAIVYAMLRMMDEQVSRDLHQSKNRPHSRS